MGEVVLRGVGWLSLIAMLVWFFGPLIGAFERPRAWGVTLVALLAIPLVLAAVHLSLASSLSRTDRERWTRGLLRFGPFGAWLYLLTTHKTSE
jgi:hypothetical protein